jgi:hypothetical protein
MCRTFSSSVSSLRSLRLGGAILLLLCAQGIAGELRSLDTKHYRIHTDLDQRLTEDLGVRMEAMYDQYTRRLAAFSRGGNTRFEVYLFTNRKDYSNFTGDRFPNTGGVFIPSRNLLAGFLEGQGRDGLRRTLQHEAFHQFAFTAIGPRLPVWLNEGIAQIFEEGLWTGRQFMIGQVPPRRIRQLQQDIRDGRLMDFRKFLALSDEQWSRDLRDAPTAASRYGQAWAMTHFLVFAPDENGGDGSQPKYRARLIEMLKLIHAGHRPDDAFVGAFSDNIEGFQRLFVEYARALRPTTEATFLENQTVLADMLVQLRSRGHRFDDPETLRRFLTEGGYRLRYSKGNVQWSSEEDPAAYFRDASGRLMTGQQFIFSLRGGAPLPDMVLRPINGIQFRTIFHDELGDRIDHETLIESPR